MTRPLILGLTGSIGMGKSTVAAMFRAFGVPVFDADATVHRLQAPGSPLLPAIEARFPGTTSATGVDRAKLGVAVLDDDAALAALEAIIHPAVRAAQTAFIAAHRAAPLVVLDIPLLFETGGASRVDRIAVVSANEATQRARVLARPGMTDAKFAAIRARQLPDAEKRARADHIIGTDCTIAATRAAVARLVSDLSGRAPGR